MSSLKSIPENWTWNDGIGFLPFGDAAVQYDKAYFDKYVGYAQTERGKAITAARAFLVQQYVAFGRLIVDLGIGSGDFIAAMRRKHYYCLGADVNPVAIEWLRKEGLLCPVATRCEVLTMWDVLEHIPDPKSLLAQYDPRLVFVSMPIYRNETHVFESKHFRPGEHCWYFTDTGLERFMFRMGYRCIHKNDTEIQLGREDIGTYVFTR